MDKIYVVVMTNYDDGLKGYVASVSDTFERATYRAEGAYNQETNITKRGKTKVHAYYPRIQVWVNDELIMVLQYNEQISKFVYE